MRLWIRGGEVGDGIGDIVLFSGRLCRWCDGLDTLLRCGHLFGVLLCEGWH